MTNEIALIFLSGLVKIFSEFYSSPLDSGGNKMI